MKLPSFWDILTFPFVCLLAVIVWLFGGAGTNKK